MKNKLIHSDYNRTTGISTVIIENKYGVFRGEAFLHPEDKKYESNYFGCQIAEARCMIKTRKAQIEDLNFQIKTLKNFENVLKNSKYYNPDSFECRKLRKQIYALEKQKRHLIEANNQTNRNIVASEERRRDLLHQIHTKKLFDPQETIFDIEDKED